MAKHDYQRDRDEIPVFADLYKGRSALACIEDYAKKRGVVSHRIGTAFWDAVREGEIEVYEGDDGISYIFSGYTGNRCKMALEGSGT